MRLGDIAKERKETFSGEKGGIRIVGLEHLISGELRFNDYEVDTENTFRKVFHKGDILFGRRRAYLKKAAIAEFDGLCSGDITVIQAIPNKVYPDLLPFIIQNDSLFDFAVSRSVGGLSPRVKWEHLSDYKLELPPIEVQRALADKLWAAYNLKEAYKKMNSAIDEMVKSQFIDLISENVEWGSLNEITTYIGKGITPKYVDRSNIAVINQACVYWTGIQSKYLKFHDALAVPKKAYLEDFDILLNSTGRGTLGRSCLFINPKDERSYITDGHVTVIKTDRNIIFPEVLVAYFSLTDVQNEIYRQYVTGSTNQIDIVFSELRKMLVPIPNIEKQKQYVKITKQADKSKFELKQAIDKIDKVMKSLLQ